MNSSSATRKVAILLYPGVQSLDVTGPLEVFAGATLALAAAGRTSPAYEVLTVAPSPQPILTSSGLTILPGAGLPAGPRGIDTLLVPGGSGRRQAVEDPQLMAWLARTGQGVRRLSSVCTGAFLLADAGLLSGRTVTTHWAYAEKLAREYPDVTVDPDPIFLLDGNVWTSAGVTAGIDLALAMVEQDHGRDLALQLARHLVMFLRRPGSQSQFSARLAAQEPRREPLRDVQQQVLEEPSGRHTVEAMAARANMSPRHFARAFRAETGVTPARYVEQVRLEAARRELEDTASPVQNVAFACGFGTAETMRRSFLRALGVSPAEYRRRFRSRVDPAPAAA